MNCHDIKPALIEVIEEFGENPYNFFHILRESDDRNVDLIAQNEINEDIKSESWHSIRMDGYVLWAITDNGDCLWWNGEQTIAMCPRDFEFMSVPVVPRQFIRLVGLGKITGIFPEEIWEDNS